MNGKINKGEISLTKDSSWRVIKQDESIIWFKGYIYHMLINELADLVLKENITTIKSFLNKLDGHFSLIVKTKNFYLISVDKVRSCPILWSIKDENILLISDKGSLIKKELNLTSLDVDKSISEAFAVSGYTIGEHTLYKNVKQINPGSYLWIEDKKLFVNKYYTWKPWNIYKHQVNLSSKLNKINEKIFKNLISSLENRQVIVPLSGGLDSRLILAGLKKFNYKNVLCISYGLKNNKDAFVAKQVAKKLGYEWIFIKYNMRDLRKYFYTKEYMEYSNFCDSFTSIHFVGEYIMLKKLSNNLIKKDAIFINGQSGDFITGNHIPEDIICPEENNKKRENNVLSKFVSKHYKHWKVLAGKESNNNIRVLLSEEVKKIGGFPNNKNKDYGIYEYLEFMDRQSKYVINGQRNYEYFGYEWRLPLWDNTYLDFWEKVPLSEKLNQRLYKNTLKKYNWGGVWKDININPKIITPAWIIPVRFLFKTFFVFRGKKHWHDFEKKYLSYFMDNLVAYAPWSYFQIILDKRGHDSAIGWLIEDYLKKKKLNWKGR